MTRGTQSARHVTNVHRQRYHGSMLQVQSVPIKLNIAPGLVCRHMQAAITES